MIGRLSGVLAAKTPAALLLDVHGVGYEVTVSLNVFCRLPEVGQSLCLEIHTHVREDALQLFGFLDGEEKTLFQLLLGVSGVGPRLALNILSGLPAEELRTALVGGDVNRLTATPGIGRKTAERLVLELRDKVGRLAGAGPAAQPPAGQEEQDAVSALVNLGYRVAEAERAVRTVAASGVAGLEALIREALRKVGS